MKKNFILILIPLFLLLPILSVYAQVPTLGGSCSNISSLDGLVGCVVSGLKIVVYLLFTFAFIYTLYGAFNFIRAEGDKRDDWRSVMINGIIGLFVMSSIWGIVGILDGTFNLSGVSPITPPEIRL
jgi:hypothetical protein